jgi:hypothetical protein
MRKISVQPVAEESVYKSMDELKQSFQVETTSNELDISVERLTPLYDETRLWEELETKYRRSVQASV